MERGLLPNDDALIGNMVSNICFGNAERYFDLPEKSIVLEEATSDTSKR
jgi:hypothetical protein